MQKNNSKQETLSCIIKEDCKDNMTEYIRQSGTNISFPNDGKSWVILSGIEQRIKEKIEKVGKPLKDWDIKIYRGILTGCNEAFIIDKSKRDELVKKDSASANIIRPILRGRDIERYKINFAGQYLINTHNGIYDKNILPIDINKYPAVKKHLDTYWQKIKNRDDQGVTPYNLRSCAYMDDFSKQKIAWASVGQTEYSLIPADTFLLDTNYFLTTNNNIKYLLGILNSKLITYWINTEDTQIGNGGAYRHYKYNLEKLHIPMVDSKIERQIEKLLQHENYQAIDCVIYELYNLNMEEIEFISSAVKP
jgi:hypothetical protein